MKRVFDCISALFALILLFMPMLLIAICIKLTSPGPVLYWSQRIGKDNHLFAMPKFRTMTIGTPIVATHLLDNPQNFVTNFGKVLRKTSLDELPQLLCILVGDMSFVGPRPALFNQDDLVRLRTEKGIHVIPPGLTGWAQINGRDELPIPVKVAYDNYYLLNRTFLLDLQIIGRTLLKIIKSEDVHH